MKRTFASVLTAMVSALGLGAVGEASAAPASGDSSVSQSVELTTTPLRQLQRARIHTDPAYQERVRAESAAGFQDALRILQQDPERNFVTDLCWSKTSVLSPCVGDVRLYDWAPKGYGLVRPVLFTNRSGATISGHVWATRSGPAKRPAIVITSGSIQATEQMYWWAAQSLAKAGYVALTTDPQNQGMSDTFGEGIDRLEGALSQATGNTFYDGTQDSLDFLLSTPSKAYFPRPSRSGHSHCAKQQRRVQAGLDAGFNPFWRMVDPTRIGLAGHSAGAQAVSYMGQRDRRVDAVVAWDNLCRPTACLERPPGAAPAVRIPALGISQDFLVGPTPNVTANSEASKDLTAAGIDSGQLFIRGGTHFEYSFVPSTLFTATLRGNDLAAWYTVAWFDKYLGHKASADARLLTTRWRTDAGDRAVDPAGRGNMYSTIYKSRLDIHRSNGTRFRCENLRAGCAGQPTSDGQVSDYSFLRAVTTPDT